MKKRKIIIWSFILVAALGLNSFAAQETKEQIKSFSQKATNDLVVALQTEKEIASKNALEKESGSYTPNLPIKLNQKLVQDIWYQTYFLRLPKETSNQYKIKPVYKSWRNERDLTTGEKARCFLFPHLFFTKSRVIFQVRNPALGTGNRPIDDPSLISIGIEKAWYSPKVEFYVTAELHGKSGGALYIHYTIYENHKYTRKIADLESKHLTYGDIYGN
jgi:hypothetical protein